MSVISTKTGLSSILKNYSATDRDKAKNAIINRVRFDISKKNGLREAVKSVCEEQNYKPLHDFIDYVSEENLNDIEFLRMINDARNAVHMLSPKFNRLVETLLGLKWTQYNSEAVQAYADFFVDLMVAHSRYINYGISNLIALWIPRSTDEELWSNGTPSEEIQQELRTVHNVLDRLLTAIPMSFDVVLSTVESNFPYFKKPSFMVAGYMHNILWLMQYKPMFTEFVMQLVLQKMILMDVNAPRNEIEDAEDEEFEGDDIEEDNANADEEQMFEMDDCPREDCVQPMNHPIAQTLDICMERMFVFLDGKNPNGFSLNEDGLQLRNTQTAKFFKVLMLAFENVILPSHNTHHVQFLIFYYCSLKHTFAEGFLSFLWNKVKDPNVSAVIRQAAVGYVASFLARSKFLSLVTLKIYLKQLCDWAHQYIQNGDQYRSNTSLKANMVFFSVCQAIFYVIAFRSRNLTADKKSLLFLQSLHLSALVNCNLNPLRVCLPAVATAFAGVTRAHQLAYCHAILERNARRKLATVYANEIATPDETLETFFPFDPYLLKISGSRITPHYLQYQASDAEEQPNKHAAESTRRKRGDSEMIEDIDVDDFILDDKRQKYAEKAKSNEREAQFTYGLSPGFHT